MKRPRSLVTITTHHPLKLLTLILLRSQCCTSHHFIVSVLCKILFCFAQRFHGAQNNNSAGHYGGGLMGRMLRLMGNASPSHRETFLTLMERGMSRVEVGGVEQGSLVPKLLQSFSGLRCHPETPLTPPVSPLSSLSTAPPPPHTHHTQAFAFLLCGNVVLTYWPLTPPSGPSMAVVTCRNFFFFFSLIL